MTQPCHDLVSAWLCRTWNSCKLSAPSPLSSVDQISIGMTKVSTDWQLSNALICWVPFWHQTWVEVLLVLSWSFSMRWSLQWPWKQNGIKYAFHPPHGQCPVQSPSLDLPSTPPKLNHGVVVEKCCTLISVMVMIPQKCWAFFNSCKLLGWIWVRKMYCLRPAKECMWDILHPWCSYKYTVVSGNVWMGRVQHCVYRLGPLCLGCVCQCVDSLDHWIHGSMIVWTEGGWRRPKTFQRYCQTRPKNHGPKPNRTLPVHTLIDTSLQAYAFLSAYIPSQQTNKKRSKTQCPKQLHPLDLVKNHASQQMSSRR